MEAVNTLINLSRPTWIGQCTSCQFGILPPQPPITSRAPLYEELTAQYLAGQLDMCDCKSGQMMTKFFIGKAESLESMPDLIDRMSLENKRRRQERLFYDAGVPPKYLHLTLDTFPSPNDPGKANAILAARTIQSQGKIGSKTGLILHGTPGVGKTGIICPIIVNALNQGISAMWVQYNDLLAQLRDFQSGMVQDRIDHCKTVSILAIDDLGDPSAERQATDYTRDVIFRIIDHRCNYGLSTLVTTNLSPSQLSSQFHARTARRLSDMCATIAVTGRTL